MRQRFPKDTALVYMLRAWQETGQPDTPVWRFSLEDPHTGVRRGFSTWESVWAFLAEQLKGAEGRDEKNGPL